MMRRLIFAFVLLVLVGCACRSTWLRSCGPAYRDWGVRSEVVGGLMVVWVERLPAGVWTIEARRNTPEGQRVLAWAAVEVEKGPMRVRVVLEPVEWAPMPADAFVVVKEVRDDDR